MSPPWIRDLRLSAILLLFALSGCVSKATYLQKADEASFLGESLRDAEARNEDLQSHNQTLSQERDALRTELSETRAETAAAREDLLRARADVERLEKVLATRRAQAGAALAEMRQSIDLLQEENRRLAALVEQERVAREARLAQVKSTYDELVRRMESEIRRGEITISELQGKLTLNLVDRILFDTGRAEIKPAGLEVLKRVGEILRKEPEREILIEGHTDNVPISAKLRPTFPTNWELSAARAISVVHYLQAKAGIPGERLSACAFGPYRPLVSNDTPKGRAQNRRIQIILLPPGGRTLEPAP